MTWSLAFDPVVAPWIIAVLGGVGAVLLVLAALRRVRGTWLRALALAALVVALTDPAALREEREALSTIVALVVDESDSQSFGDRAATTEAMREALVQRLAGFDNVEIRTIRAGPGGANADGTELFNAANAGLADVPPDRIGAVIMLSDGQVHDAPDGAPDFGGAPLHALISGSEDERDRRIVVDNAPRFGIVGELQTIDYRVIDEGAPAGTAVDVTVTLDGEVLDTRTVIAGQSNGFAFVVPHGGRSILELEVEPLEGELTEANNRTAIEITGVRETLRVLLVSGEPHAGERVWRSILKSDAAVDLIHFTILRPPEKQDATPVEELALIPFPTTELFVERIDGFDLIIFDRYQNRGVLPLVYFDNITRYIAEGGAVLIAAGPDDMGPASIYNTSLYNVLPAFPTGETIETPFHPTVTEAGQRHPVTRDLAGADTDPPQWSRWFRQIVADDPSGDVVMAGAHDQPLLVLGHEGDGRIALLLSDQAWLWARGFEEGGPYVDLLRRLGHWLMKEPDLEEEVLRAEADGGTLTIERQTMGDTVGPVAVETPSGAISDVTLTEVEPGLWRATLPAGELGLWRFREGDLVAVTSVGPANPREFVDVRSTADVLQPAVDATGGTTLRMAEGGRLDVPRVLQVRPGARAGGADWLGVRMTQSSILLGIDRLPLFAGFLGLAVLLGLLAVAWYREGR
ncbi:MAG: hypothetical protein KIS96_12910 [Bauldia sp.]|nr:hypothetical protein [Bauldia sp.]